MVRVAGGDLGQAAVAFWRDNALGMAAMIAFYAFLSLIPLVLLALAFFGGVLSSVVAAQDVRHLFEQVMPGLTKEQFVDTYWNPVHHSKVATTILGAISLLLGTTGLHDSIDWAVNRIWRSPEGRPFWISKVRGLAIVLWVIAFALLSLGLAWVWAIVLASVHASSLGIATWLSLVPPFVLDAAVLSALYKLTPTVETHVYPSVAAGVLAAVFWGLSKLAFAWWVVEVSSYNRVYGPLAASIIVMLWLWITALIFLFGAELQCRIQRRRTSLPDGQRHQIVV